MYHLIVDADSPTIKTMKRSSDTKEHMEYWYNRIKLFNPDSITLWDGPILLDYCVNAKAKEQK